MRNDWITEKYTHLPTDHNRTKGPSKGKTYTSKIMTQKSCSYFSSLQERAIGATVFSRYWKVLNVTSYDDRQYWDKKVAKFLCFIPDLAIKFSGGWGYCCTWVIFCISYFSSFVWKIALGLLHKPLKQSWKARDQTAPYFLVNMFLSVAIL